MNGPESVMVRLHCLPSLGRVFMEPWHKLIPRVQTRGKVHIAAQIPRVPYMKLHNILCLRKTSLNWNPLDYNGLPANREASVANSCGLSLEL